MHTTQYQVTSPIKNGQKTWTDIFQKIRWTYKKIFNIAECQRNANPNHRGMCAHTGQKGAPGPGWGPRSQSRGSFGAGASASPFTSWSHKHVGCCPGAVHPLSLQVGMVSLPGWARPLNGARSRRYRPPLGRTGGTARPQGRGQEGCDREERATARGSARLSATYGRGTRASCGSWRIISSTEQKTPADGNTETTERVCACRGKDRGVGGTLSGCAEPAGCLAMSDPNWPWDSVWQQSVFPGDDGTFTATWPTLPPG